jgi:hypothetical protein
MIYVDGLQVLITTKMWRHGEGCHMVADSLRELHMFAGKLKLGPSWFQGSYYFLTPTKRRMAIRAGATELLEVTEFLKKVHTMMEAKE